VDLATCARKTAYTAGAHLAVRRQPRGRLLSRCVRLSDLDEASDEIRDEDLEIQTFRSGGAGGQHVNKTESAVRIIHQPAESWSAVSRERSQHKNKSSAIEDAAGQALRKRGAEKAAKMGDVHAQKKAIEWGSQSLLRARALSHGDRPPLRSQSEQRGRVLDGELDQFIHAYLIAGKDESPVNKEPRASDPSERNQERFLNSQASYFAPSLDICEV